MKQLLKTILVKLHIALTRNQRYDAYTRKIIALTLKNDSNCIDIGCHRGEILDLMIRSAPAGLKMGFEPIPELFDFLTQKYGGDQTVRIYSTALYDRAGTTTFQHVTNAPAYSGIKQRKYDGKNVTIDQITVTTGRLDDILPAGLTVDLIKIDVEGAELRVMKGAEETLKRCRPVVIFEFGLGASDFYNSGPDDLHGFLTQTCGLQITTLKSFLGDRSPLTAECFRDIYKNGTEYYFVAFPA